MLRQLCLMCVVALMVFPVQAREWVNRDGAAVASGELVAVDSHGPSAVIRDQQRGEQRVPLHQLSREDRLEVYAFSGDPRLDNVTPVTRDSTVEVALNQPAPVTPTLPLPPPPSPSVTTPAPPTVINQTGPSTATTTTKNRRLFRGHHCDFHLIDQHGTVAYSLGHHKFVADIIELATSDPHYRHWAQEPGTGSPDVLQWATAVNADCHGHFAIWLKRKSDGKWVLFDKASRVSAH